MPNPEPRFSRIAAAIADPSRARMLAALLSGKHRSAGNWQHVQASRPKQPARNWRIWSMQRWSPRASKGGTNILRLPMVTLRIR